MSLSLNVLEHLGFNLYSNVPAVLSEVVANAWDADAKNVNISIEVENGRIVISDDGHGMTLDDINDKFLLVGYAKRANGEAFSYKFKRPVMGRKGIGKLSLFSIANQIEVRTARINSLTGKLEKNGFILRRKDIERQIGKDKKGTYNPEDILEKDLDVKAGTKLIITDFKKSFDNMKSFLRKRLAKRFSVISIENKFSVSIDGKPITLEDRDYFKKLQMIWSIGNYSLEPLAKFEIQRSFKASGKIDGTEYEVSGWIGAVELPSDLLEDGINNNKISILCRGKLAQEDILETYNEGGIYSAYLIGEITADFLDDDNKEDISTSSRQKIKEDDARYLAVQNHVYKILKEIQGKWSETRLALASKTALVKAEESLPGLQNWFDNLSTSNAKTEAKKLFATIQSLHFDKHHDVERKKELYKQGVLAFERLRMRDNLQALEKITSADALELSTIFSDLRDLEANMYYDIASERVEIITKFQNLLNTDQKEKVLQTYLFDNLWLLNPSWERATEGTERFEENVMKEFGKINANLSKQEKSGRIDLKYRTAAGKHVIIELKKYSPSYTITPGRLSDQVRKYIIGLRKCLTAIDRGAEPIEAIVILGDIKDANTEEFNDQLKPLNARMIRYDYLIDQSLLSYSEYMDRYKKVGKIRQLLAGF